MSNEGVMTDEDKLCEQLAEALDTIREVCQEFGIKATLDIWPVNGQVFRLSFKGEDEEMN